MQARSILREARRHAGLTQRELARRAGVPQPAVSRIERGRASPRFDTMERLLRACGMALELVDRPGLGVDRTLVRDRLRLPAGQRVRRVALEWERTRAFRRRQRPTA